MPTDKVLIPKKLLVLLFLNFFAAFFLLVFTQMTVNKSQTAKSRASNEAPDEFVEPPPAIIGGEPAKKGDFPYFAAIFSKPGVKLPDPARGNLDYDFEPGLSFLDPGGFICGGTLIGSKWILTAAHCVSTYVSRAEIIGVAINIITKSGYVESFAVADKTFFAVKNIFVHPKFIENTLDSMDDIALLELDKDVVDINPAFLPQETDSQFYTPRNQVTAVGFGCIDRIPILNFPISTNNLRFADMPIIETIDDEKRLIIGLAEINKDRKGTCRGDSGGPALYSSDGNPYILGIISARDLYRFPGLSITTKVNSYTDCINRFIEQKNNGEDANFCEE